MHGLSVPLGKLGYHLPRTISSVIEARAIEEPELFRSARIYNEEQPLRNRQRRRLARSLQDEPSRPVFRAGGSIIQPGISGSITPRERTLPVIKLEDITRDNLTGDKQGGTPASGIEGSAAVGFTDNVGTPVYGNGGHEQKVDEQGK